MGRVWPNPNDPDEPYFLEEDTEAVLEWQREQDLKCSGCGLPRDETMVPEAHQRYEGTTLYCHACAASARHEDQFSKKNQNLHGVFFAAKERDTG